MTLTNTDTTNNEQQSGVHEEWQGMGDELVATMKKLFKEGNIRRIIIKHEGQTVMEIPLTVGVAGTLLAPWLAAIGAMGALLTHCTIEVVRTEKPSEPPVAQS